MLAERQQSKGCQHKGAVDDQNTPGPPSDNAAFFCRWDVQVGLVHLAASDGSMVGDYAAHPPPSHRKNQLASTVCTPFRMTLSAAKPAFVFNWMKVSEPWVTQ